jgi:ectoine hydroxylase-related dioxygenase (phytanoyl-CoA dioxygenase family)
MTADVESANLQLLELDMSVRTTVPFSTLATDGGRAALRETLDTFGFAVVSDVLDGAAVAAAEALFDADLCSIIDRQRSTDSEKVSRLLDSGTASRWPVEELPVGLDGMAADYGLPQGQCAWSIRRNRNIRAVYEALHGTTELCVGCDNVFFTSAEVAAGTNAHRPMELWPHSDCDVHKAPEGAYDVFQSVMYLWPADADSSATVMWPGSNNEEYAKLMEGGEAFAEHFCMMPASDFGRFAQHARRVPVPRGGLLVWNSRTIHQGWNSGKRLAVPVCMEPSVRRRMTALRVKERCVAEGMPTTHWASLGISNGMHYAPEPEGDPRNVGVALLHAAHAHCKTDGAIQPSIQALL